MPCQHAAGHRWFADETYMKNCRWVSVSVSDHRSVRAPELLTRRGNWCNTVRPIWRTLRQTSAKALVRRPPLVLALARCRQLLPSIFSQPRPAAAAATQEPPGRRTDAVRDDAAMSGVLGPVLAVGTTGFEPATPSPPPGQCTTPNGSMRLITSFRPARCSIRSVRSRPIRTIRQFAATEFIIRGTGEIRT
jgi:hypothetical protein